MHGQTPKLLTPAPTPGKSVDSDSGSDSSSKKKVDSDSDSDSSSKKKVDSDSDSDSKKPKMESAPGLTPTPESESPIFDLKRSYSTMQGARDFK